MIRYADLYKKELLESVVPFWDKYSINTANGGYYTCLLEDGSCFDTDKFIWLQARSVWTYAMLYEEVANKDSWLKNAIHGAEFLKKYGRDEQGNWYFSVTEKGAPLIQPYNIFSDCFATMAFSRLSKITGNQEYAEIAESSFKSVLARQKNPKGIYEKSVATTRPLQGFSLPMILCNLSLEMEHLLDTAFIDQVIEEALNQVMNRFYDPNIGLIREFISPEGKAVDSFEGRLINPGHGIEAMWFVMDLAKRNNDEALIQKAWMISEQIMNFGWDQDFGGILYFKDIKGFPPQQLEWDQKLWWVHLESLVCAAKAYSYTNNKKAQAWFEKIHEYSWDRFRDPINGEWYGYLNRAGSPLLTLKGGKWKGFFHVPRALWQVAKTLEATSVKVANAKAMLKQDV